MTQNEALALLDSGKSMLITGAAGTGKTYVLNEFISRMKSRGRAIAVTATTGLAATHLNGTTIHAWSGIGVHDSLHSNFFTKLSKSRKDLISKAEILIIDEISMLHDYRLDMVEEVTRRVRERNEPFGGLQVILCGDFYQLPPVNRSDSIAGGFITNSNIWKSGFFSVGYLETQFRQAEDVYYTEILNGIRAGFLSGRQLARLRARVGAFADPWSAQTRLLTTNADVDNINLEHLNKLEGETHEFIMESSGGKNYVESLKKSCLAQETLLLKTGAHVMCVRNSPDRKYVNGSLGIVKSFAPGTGYPVISLINGREVTIKPETWELLDGDKKRASIVQLPIRLAWAITVHKSQGMTLDAARIDLSRAFVEGMGYVALSRVRSLEHLVIDGINGMALRVSSEAKSIDKDLRLKSQEVLTSNNDLIQKWVKAEAKRSKKKPHSRKPTTNWQNKLEKMRQKYPNAYKPWTDKEDETLRKGYLKKKSLEKLSQQLGRHSGAVIIRLKKHFGEDIEIK